MKNKFILILMSTLIFLSLIGCEQTINDNPAPKAEQKHTDISEDLDISKFIPSKKYKVEFRGNDLSSELIYIRGDGEIYEAIGINGKGYYKEVFKTINNILYLTNTYDLSNIENMDDNYFNNISKEEFNVSGDSSNYKTLIKPTSKTKESDTIKISESGENLELTELKLNGEYIKIVENENIDNSKLTKITYYSEGLGIVKYEILMDNTIMEFSELNSFEEIK